MAYMLSMDAPVEAPVRPPDSLIGTRLHGFEIIRALSSGGMGVVYEALHPLIGRRAAVKVIRPELCSDESVTARFLREARAVSAIKQRNVVEILDFGALPGGAPYMMMEFLEGDTLAQVIAREAPMPPSEALHICQEILSGLSAAHQVGVVHRDLKPANIVLLKESGGELIVKVLDFGLARQLDAAPEPTTPESLHLLSLEKSSLLVGTPDYICPEQASGEQVGAQGDLYCLGVVLYEMLTGQLPFKSGSAWELVVQHRDDAPPPLRDIIPGIDPRLEEFVMRLMKKDPAERPLGAKEAGREVAELRALVETSGFPDTMVVNRAGQRGFGRKHLLKWRAAGLLALGLTVSVARPPTPAPDWLGLATTAVAMTPPAIPLAPEPVLVLEPPRPHPRMVAAAPAPAPAVKPRARAVAETAGTACESTESWRRTTRAQLDGLEKLSLAKTKDDAPPSEVAKIKQKARGLATSVKNAHGGECRQVRAELLAWSLALR